MAWLWYMRSVALTDVAKCTRCRQQSITRRVVPRYCRRPNGAPLALGFGGSASLGRTQALESKLAGECQGPLKVIVDVSAADGCVRIEHACLELQRLAGRRGDLSAKVA